MERSSGLVGISTSVIEGSSGSVTEEIVELMHYYPGHM